MLVRVRRLPPDWKTEICSGYEQLQLSIFASTAAVMTFAFQCATCGETHEGMSSFVAAAPVMGAA